MNLTKYLSGTLAGATMGLCSFTSSAGIVFQDDFSNLSYSDANFSRQELVNGTPTTVTGEDLSYWKLWKYSNYSGLYVEEGVDGDGIITIESNDDKGGGILFSGGSTVTANQPVPVSDRVDPTKGPVDPTMTFMNPGDELSIKLSGIKISGLDYPSADHPSFHHLKLVAANNSFFPILRGMLQIEFSADGKTRINGGNPFAYKGYNFVPETYKVQELPDHIELILTPTTYTVNLRFDITDPVVNSNFVDDTGQNFTGFAGGSYTFYGEHGISPAMWKYGTTDQNLEVDGVALMIGAANSRGPSSASPAKVTIDSVVVTHRNSITGIQ
ncbi:MAG: hypothetical protein OEZ58_12505 [Gammaproteobacteria bacterium]|nr:hypothetical protein [Gammaproteobacteria bacterium]MDH5729807.1 hypothetical protein [Gammaproteobacteria bacterium]